MKVNRIHITISLLILVSGILVGCSTDRPRSGKVRIVATTGMIGDAVRNIAGDSAEVFVLMGPGVDPHLYKPTPRDVDKLSEADIIVYNGLHLEGKMGEILEKIGKQKPVIALAEKLSPTLLLVVNEDREPGDHIVYDPHIWFNVDLWKRGVRDMGLELSRLDSASGNHYLANLARYEKQLDSLHQWTRAMIQSIPEKQRVLITAHDAFSYFGKAYGMEVQGLQGISTVAEPGLKDISNLVDYLSQRQIKAVFVESSVSEKAINAVIEGCARKNHRVIIGGVLYSDAMGPAGSEEGTYIGMVRHNVKAMVGGLK